MAYKFSLNVTYQYADLMFITEQVPNPNSMVSLSSQKDRFGFPIAKVDWQLTQYDWENMKRVFHLCRESLFSQNNYHFSHGENDYFWESIIASGAHHVGTARMAENEKFGVVDKNLKFFGVSNLFICDGSIFPTSGNVNVGLTISAFAMRLAEFLTTTK